MADWLLPLAPSTSVASILNLEFSHSTWKFSPYLEFLISGIVLVAFYIVWHICILFWYVDIFQTAPSLTSYVRLPPIYLILCLPFYSTVHSWDEAVCGMPIVLLFHFVHFLFVCCARLAACEFCSCCTILHSIQFHNFYFCYHAFHTTIYCLLFKICCKQITV